MAQITKDQIADILESIAQMLEIKGENVFKIRAYTNAARALETYTGDIAAAAGEGRLGEIPGVGKAIAEKITELAGCDLLTISPTLLGELAASTEPLVKKLDAAAAQALSLTQVHLDEKTFRYELNEDAMATEKTAQGIRSFAADIVKLEQLIAAKL